MATKRTTPRRSAAEWRQLIEAQAASGLSRRAFCERHGLAVSTFGYWKRKLRQAGPALEAEGQGQASAPGWLEVTGLLEAAASPATGRWQIELDLGHGLCLRLRQG